MQKIKNDNKYQHCPLCNSKSIRYKGRISYGPTVRFATFPVELSNNIELWQCLLCLSYFSQNIISESDAMRLYKNAGCERWGMADYEHEKNSDLADFIKILFKENFKILDVGCNSGALLDFAAKFGAQTFGIEISDACAQVARQKGHKIFSDFGEIASGCKYDIIFACDIVEHLYNIQDFFGSISKLLNKGGKLVLFTGNPFSLSARLSKNKWWYFGYPEHIIFPSLKFFENLKNFRVAATKPFYNSKEHRRESIFYLNMYFFHKLFKFFYKIFSLNYTGRPLVDKDHILIILELND